MTRLTSWPKLNEITKFKKRRRYWKSTWKSEEWREGRARAISGKTRCSWCQKKYSKENPPTIHHYDYSIYDRANSYRYNDLSDGAFEVICRNCHERHHHKIKGRCLCNMHRLQRKSEKHANSQSEENARK